MQPELIDSIGKLSIEVVAVIALTYVIYLLAKAVNKLGESHQILAMSVQGNERVTEKISNSNDRLIHMVDTSNQLNMENIKVTRELVDTMRNNKCPAVQRR